MTGVMVEAVEEQVALEEQGHMVVQAMRVTQTFKAPPKEIH